MAGVKQQRCVICGCTEREPCNPPCSWYGPGICTTCARAAIALSNWQGEALKPNLRALLRAFRDYHDRGGRW